MTPSKRCFFSQESLLPSLKVRTGGVQGAPEVLAPLQGVKSIPPLDTMFGTWHNARATRVIRREESDPRLHDGR